MSWKEITELVCSNLPDANLVAATAGAASAFAAFWTIRRASKARANERYLDYAVTTLERAFSALMGRSEAGALPPSDRLGWLTSARLIEEYKSAKKRIKDPIILQECESHEEHWRNQFHLALSPLENISPEYYSPGKGAKKDKAPIHDVSAIIIHAFASWPKGKADPIDAYETTEVAISKLGVSPWWITLRRHLDILN